MKWLYVFALTLGIFSCRDADQQKARATSDSDLDAARNFLNAALKGDYATASTYMLKDSTNLGYLTVTERTYKTLDPARRDSLKSASLRFYDTRQVNDSTTVTIFANSYKNDKDTLKMVKVNGQWLVDLKYLFEHDMDTNMYHGQQNIDTIHK